MKCLSFDNDGENCCILHKQFHIEMKNWTIHRCRCRNVVLWLKLKWNSFQKVKLLQFSKRDSGKTPKTNHHRHRIFAAKNVLMNKVVNENCVNLVTLYCYFVWQRSFNIGIRAWHDIRSIYDLINIFTLKQSLLFYMYIGLLIVFVLFFSPLMLDRCMCMWNNIDSDAILHLS